MGLALSYLLLVRASKLFAKGGGHEIYCLRRAGIAFCRRNHQAYGSRMGEVDKVKVRARDSKGYQRRKDQYFGEDSGPSAP